MLAYSTSSTLTIPRGARATKLSRLRLGVHPNGNSQAQDCQGNQKLEDLDNKLGGLVLVVVRLLGGDILRPRRDRRCIDFTHQILIHHRTGSVAVPDILEIISCILACIRLKWIVVTAYLSQPWSGTG